MAGIFGGKKQQLRECFRCGSSRHRVHISSAGLPLASVSLPFNSSHLLQSQGAEKVPGIMVKTQRRQEKVTAVLAEELAVSLKGFP